MVNFRMALMRAMRKEGWEITVIAADDGGRNAIEAEGIRFVPWDVKGRDTNPLVELRSFHDLYRSLKEIGSAIAFNYTIKPVIYGSLAAALLRMRSVAVITGLGFIFLDGSWKNAVVRRLYRFAFRFAAEAWFLNEDDRQFFRQARLIGPDDGRILPGEGVDVTRFAPRPARPEDGRRVFLMLSRLVYDKGVGEYFEAAAALKARRPEMVFRIAGALDESARAGISRSEIDRLAASGVIEYLGRVSDVRPLIAEADFVVLSSYREGLSRALLEAASMGKPIVATDVPGCRQLVDEGVNGFLAAPRDAAALASAIERAGSVGRREAAAMGMRGRELVMERYSDERIIAIYKRWLADCERSGGRELGRCRMS